MTSRLSTAERLLSKMGSLPTIPHVATQAMSLLDDAAVSMDSIASLVLSDQVLTTRLLKVVNSPMFRPSQPIESLKQGLVYLGAQNIREILLACSVVNMMKFSHESFSAGCFWTHSFGVGMIAEKIASAGAFCEAEKAYIAGIVHDIGEVAISNFLVPEFNEIVSLVMRDGMPFRTAEYEILGTSHCEIGYLLAKQWNFPEDLASVVLKHHDPSLMDDNEVLAAITHLSDEFCMLSGLGFGVDHSYTFAVHGNRAWDILKQASPSLEKFDFERFRYQIDDEIPVIREAVDRIFDFQ